MTAHRSRVWVVVHTFSDGRSRVGKRAYATSKDARDAQRWWARRIELGLAKWHSVGSVWHLDDDDLGRSVVVVSQLQVWP